MGKFWVKQLGVHLVNKVEEKMHENFVKEIEQGKRLSYLELRKLNSVYKKDYIVQIMKDSDEAIEYVKNHRVEVQDKHHEIV